MKSPDHVLGALLDTFPASELHSTHLFVRALIPFAKLNTQRGAMSLDTVSGEQLAVKGLMQDQISVAVAVLRSIHKEIYDEQGTVGGIGTMRFKPPSLSLSGDVSGLMWLPIEEIDEELSKREHAFPLNQKVSIRISTAGDVRLDTDVDSVCSLTVKELKYIRFLVANPRSSLKRISVGVNASDSNASRDIREINKKTKVALNLKHELITWRQAVGYFLNNEDYNIRID